MDARCGGWWMEAAVGEITVLLSKWSNGDSDAFDQLLPLVYPTCAK